MCVPLYYFAAKFEPRHTHKGRATGGSFLEYSIYETRRAHDKPTHGSSGAKLRAPEPSTRASYKLCLYPVATRTPEPCPPNSLKLP
jgi:hypothetical protein